MGPTLVQWARHSRRAILVFASVWFVACYMAPWITVSGSLVVVALAGLLFHVVCAFAGQTMGVLFLALALTLAIEFEDKEVEKRAKHLLRAFSEPRHFDDGCFGFFFHLQERWPRGQLSALLMTAEVGGGGRWEKVRCVDSLYPPADVLVSFRFSQTVAIAIASPRQVS